MTSEVLGRVSRQTRNGGSILLLTAFGCLGACVLTPNEGSDASRNSPPRSTVSADSATVVHLAAEDLPPVEFHPQQVFVLLFLARDCPIAGRYAPTLKALQAEHRQATWYAVYDAATHDLTQAQVHLEEFGLSFLPLLDDGALRRAVEARRTPTVAVLRVSADGSGNTPESGLSRRFELVYRGRIDDWYATFGKRRPKATTRELAEALEAAESGVTLPLPWPEPIGCSIDDQPPAGDPTLQN